MDIIEFKAGQIKLIQREAHALLSPSDWYITRKTETDADIPTEISAYRAAVRSVCDQRTALWDNVITEEDYFAVLYVQDSWPAWPEEVE